MRQKFFAVLNSDSADVGEMRIYGVIGDYWDDNTADDFVRAFKALERTCSRINIHINSPGGSVHDGLPICNMIKASKKEVHTYVDGIAYSMGAMIAISAKKGRVHMAKGSLLMLHSVSTWIYGNAQALREEADVLDTYDDVLGGLIAGRTGKTLDVVKSEYLNHTDHFFTPDKAKAEGLIDVIEDYEAEDMPDNVRNMSMGQVAAWYEGRMEEPSDTLMDKITNRLKSVFGGGKINQEDMFGNKFSKLTALAKVAVGAVTKEDVDAVNEQIVEAGVHGVTVVLDTELETVTNENTQLKTDKENLESEKKALEQKVSEKDAKITELEGKLAKAESKPAAEAGAPAKDGDELPAGDGEVKEDEFITEFDREAQALFGK